MFRSRKNRSRLHPSLGGPRLRRGRGYSLFPLSMGAIIIVLTLILLFARSTAADIMWRVTAPVGIIGNGIFQGTSYLLVPFTSKIELRNENTALRAQNAQLRADAADRILLAEENAGLKATLGQQETTASKILAHTLARPPQLPYDVIILSVGSVDGVQYGHLVGSGAAVLGVITDISLNTSRATLFTSPGKNTSALLRGKTLITLTGDGGGSFTAQIPQSTEAAPGDTVELPGGTGSVVAVVQNISTETGKSFETVYLAAPVNLFSLPTLEVWQIKLPESASWSTTTRP